MYILLVAKSYDNQLNDYSELSYMVVNCYPFMNIMWVKVKLNDVLKV